MQRETSSNAAKRHNHRLSSMNESEEPQLSQRTAGTLTSLHITGTSTTATCRCTTTGMSRTLPKNCTSGNSTVFRDSSHTQDCWNLWLHVHSMSTTNSTCGISAVFCTVCTVGTRLRRTQEVTDSVGELDLMHHPEAPWNTACRITRKSTNRRIWSTKRC